MGKDTVIALLSDMHSGSTTALFPHYKKLKHGFWQFKHTRYVPNGAQCDMFDFFDKCAVSIKRKDKRLIIVHDGDSVDGNHHNSLQVTSHNPDEQIDVNIWLMGYFMGKTGFAKNKGDKLYLVSGTEIHVGEREDRIGQELGAEQTPAGTDVFDFLPLEVNGRLIWFLHHGAAAGKGVTSGDGLRNYLKQIYWECLEAGRRIPDLVVSGHVHKPTYNAYIRPTHTIHGIILPSWQTKTRFGYRVAPTEVNRVGMQTVEIKADGTIIIPPAMLMNIEDRTVTA